MLSFFLHIQQSSYYDKGSRMTEMVKSLPAMRETWFNPWVRKTLWRRKWQPTPVLLPGKSHGQRILVGYSRWGHKELDMTECSLFYTMISGIFPNFPYILLLLTKIPLMFALCFIDHSWRQSVYVDKLYISHQSMALRNVNKLVLHVTSGVSNFKQHTK